MGAAARYQQWVWPDTELDLRRFPAVYAGTSRVDRDLRLTAAEGVLLYDAREPHTVVQLAARQRRPVEEVFAALLALEQRGLLRLVDASAEETRARASAWLGRPALLPGEATLDRLWVRAVERFADRPFFTWGGDASTFTYAEADSIVRRAMTLLERRGYRPGDRVMVQAHKHPETLFMIIAATLLGVTLALTWADLDGPPFGELVRRVGARHVWLSAGSQDSGGLQVDSVLRLGDPSGALSEAIAAEEPRAELPRFPEDWPSAIIFTSGSTGRPKGVIHHQAAIYRSSAITGAAQVWSCHDRYLGSTGMHSITSYRAHAWMPLHVGAHTIMVPEIPGPLGFWALTAAHQVTLIGATPPFFTWSVREAARVREVWKPGFPRLVYSTGSPLSAEARLEFWRCFGIPTGNTYGVTELCGPTLSVSADRMGSGDPGAGLPWESLALVTDPDGVPLPDGVVGELRIYTDNRMIAYLDGHGGLEFVDGWAKTGDRATRSADGAIHVLGREGRLLKDRVGENIYPEPIERLLVDITGADDAAVVLGPSLQLVAVIEHPRPGEGWAILAEARVRAVMDRRQVPTGWHAVAALPRTSTGKVDLLEVTRWVADGRLA